MGIEAPVVIHCSPGIPWQARYGEALLAGLAPRGSVVLTSGNDAGGEGTHIVLGPNVFRAVYGELRSRGRDVITINRAFLGSVLGHEDNPYVAIGWNGYNNLARFAFPYEDRWELPHSRMAPALQEIEHRCLDDWSDADIDVFAGPALILGEYESVPKFYHRASEDCRDHDLNVCFRPHPQGAMWGRLKQSHEPTLHQCIDMASVVLTHHSTAAIDALLRGTPVISYDQESMCWPLTPHGLTDALDITLDLSGWMEWLAWCQWTIEEIAAGEPWEWL